MRPGSLLLPLALALCACDGDGGWTGWDATDAPDAPDVQDTSIDTPLDSPDDPGEVDDPGEEDDPGPPPCSPEALVGSITQGNIYDTIDVLTRFPERTSHAGQQAALEYLESRLTEQGVEHVLQSYSWSGNTWANVEVTIPGGDLASQIYAAGGHYDSMSEWGNAPGADDNGSGVAALVEVARVMSGCSFRRTVKLVFFSNEEPGTIGSTFYATQASGRGDDIRAFIALDSIGYGPPAEDIDAVTLPSDAWLVDRIEAASATYVGASLARRVLDACG